jgi:stage V sporulation protein G
MTRKKTTAPQASTLTVTAVQVLPLREPLGKTKALARVMLNDSLQLTGLRVIDGVGGLFVSYPVDPSFKGDEYRSLYYPVTRELREHIESVVLAEYQKVVG